MTEFQRVALAHPEIAFQLYRDDAPVYNLPAGGLHSRVVGILGKGSAAKLLEVAVETSIARVSGFIGRPSSARQRNREQFLFVNGRFFKSPFFHKAIIQAYEKLIPQTVQPSYFLYLEIDPEEIDVNVHPQKTEVKFTSQSAVWQIINAAVRETLAKSGAVPMMDFDSEDRLEIPVLGGWDSPSAVREPAVVRSGDYNPFTKYSGASDPRGGAEFGERGSEQAELDMGEYRGERGTIRARHETDEVVYDSSQFDYISSEASAVQRTFDEADPLHSPFNGTGDGRGFSEPKTFSGATAIGEGYAAALYSGMFVAIDLRVGRARRCFSSVSQHSSVRAKPRPSSYYSPSGWCFRPTTPTCWTTTPPSSLRWGSTSARRASIR